MHEKVTSQPDSPFSPGKKKQEGTVPCQTTFSLVIPFLSEHRSGKSVPPTPPVTVPRYYVLCTHGGGVLCLQHSATLCTHYARHLLPSQVTKLSSK